MEQKRVNVDFRLWMIHQLDKDAKRLGVVAEVAGQALNILDRFHIMVHMNKTIDKVRAAEVRELKAKGREPVLAGSRWCLLKRVENLTDKQAVKLKELVAINLKTVRAYLLKEEFQFFWQYKSAAWAGKYLDVLVHANYAVTAKADEGSRLPECCTLTKSFYSTGFEPKIRLHWAPLRASTTKRN